MKRRVNEKSLGDSSTLFYAITRTLRTPRHSKQTRRSRVPHSPTNLHKLCVAPSVLSEEVSCITTRQVNEMSANMGKFEFVIPPSPTGGRKRHGRTRTDDSSRGSSAISALQGLAHLDSYSTQLSGRFDDSSLALTVTTASSTDRSHMDEFVYDTTPDDDFPMAQQPLHNSHVPQDSGFAMNSDSPGRGGRGRSLQNERKGPLKKKKSHAIESLLKDIFCGVCA